jgi:hypothetical protein
MRKRWSPLPSRRDGSASDPDRWVTGGRPGRGRRRTALLSAAGLLLAMAAAIVPAASAEAAQSTDCLDKSTGSISTSTPAVLWGESFRLTWNATPACPLSEVGLRLVGPQGVATGVTGTSGSNWFRALSTGPWALYAQSWVTGGMKLLASAFLQVDVPPALTDGVNPVDIVDDDLAGRQRFVSAVQTPGVTVRLASDLDLDLSGLDRLRVAPGVSILGDRALNPRGPRLFTKTLPAILFQIGDDNESSAYDGDGVRISGIRLEGAITDDPFSATDLDDSDGIQIQSSISVEIDHSEIFHWAGAAVQVVDNRQRINRDNASSVWIHDNYLHHNNNPTADLCCSGHGAGYGVEISYGGYALVERNVFSDDRHAITGDGRPGTGYLFYRNLILASGGVNGNALAFHTHVIDMHGRGCVAYQCGPAGEYMDIKYNTVLYTSAAAVKLRGTPSDRMELENNVFAHGDVFDAVKWTEVPPALHVNLAGFNPAANSRISCDIDGDGVDDNFMAAWYTWWYYSSRIGRWIYFDQSSATLNSVVLSDTNGDGYCDATANGHTAFGPGGIGINGRSMELFYRTSTGVAVTGAVGSDARFSTLQTVGGFQTGWTHIVPVGGRLLFYRASDGVAVTGSVATDGRFTTLQTVGGFQTGWTHIVPAGDRRLLFYRASDGVAVTGSVDLHGRYTGMQSVGPIQTGWTHIVPAGDGRLLFYRASDGVAVTGSVDIHGRLTTLQTVGGFQTGWTHIVPAGDGRLLFYRASDGVAVTGSVASDGRFTTLQTVGGFQTGWSQIAPVHLEFAG